MKNQIRMLAAITAAAMAVSMIPYHMVQAAEEDTFVTAGSADGKIDVEQIAESSEQEDSTDDTPAVEAGETASGEENSGSAGAESDRQTAAGYAQNQQTDTEVPGEDSGNPSNETEESTAAERQLILIGDSRTVYMHRTVGDDGQIWSCKGGIGQVWMKGVGVPAVEKYISSDTNVVILMGVNDAWQENTSVTTTSYAEYLNEKADEWTAKGANVFFVSVNPIRENWGSKVLLLTNASIDQFNAELRQKLNSKVHFIDTNSQIHGSAGFVDALHYDDATYQKIYQLIKEDCAKYRTDKKNENRVSGDFSSYYYISNPEEQNAEKVNMYRMYNPNSGEHFYTRNEAERDHLVKVGWKYEGVGWKAPATSKTPVYRVYNPHSGLHHYTMNAGEKNVLVSLGWNDEGIGWYSDDCRRNIIYREYNPHSGQHNYTSGKQEHEYLISVGWRDESYGWFGM